MSQIMISSSLLEDMFAADIETMIVSVKKDKLSDDYPGQVLTPELAEEIRGLGICPTGEDGEFHTLVLNAPWFKSRLEIKKGNIVEDELGHRLLYQFRLIIMIASKPA